MVYCLFCVAEGKMHRKAFGGRVPPEPAGELTALRRPLDMDLERMGPHRGMEEGKGKEMAVR